MTWHRQSKKQDLAERAAFVANKARFEDVVVMLGLESDNDKYNGNKHPNADCPACRAYGTLKPCHGGKGWYCEDCGEKGDMIGLVCIRRDVGRALAIKMLEEALQPKRDDRTGDLFAKGGA